MRAFSGTMFLWLATSIAIGVIFLVGYAAWCFLFQSCPFYLMQLVREPNEWEMTSQYWFAVRLAILLGLPPSIWFVIVTR